MKCDKNRMLLYAVTDRAWLGTETLYEQVEQALRGGATCVQLREKELGYEEFLREAVELKELCGRYGVPLIINDSVEIMLQSGADGVHIGQGDGDVTEIRKRIGPDKLLGVSAHTVEEAVRAERDGADYLGAGAVFATGTKPDAGSLSHETLQAICRAVSIPVVGIGGISEKNVARLSPAAGLPASRSWARFSRRRTSSGRRPRSKRRSWRRWGCDTRRDL